MQAPFSALYYLFYKQAQERLTKVHNLCPLGSQRPSACYIMMPLTHHFEVQRFSPRLVSACHVTLHVRLSPRAQSPRDNLEGMRFRLLLLQQAVLAW